MEDAAALRIGELAARLGLSVPVLRRWEQRYAVVAPTRSPSGFRLYSASDERRLRRMLALIAGGARPREAARIVRAEAAAVSAAAGDVPLLHALGERLARALEDLDAASAHEQLDRLLGGFGLLT